MQPTLGGGGIFLLKPHMSDMSHLHVTARLKWVCKDKRERQGRSQKKKKGVS